MKWPSQPMHKDFRVAEWVYQGEQLIISTLSYQGARGQWEELIILCKETPYPKPSWSSRHGVIQEDRGSSSWPPWDWQRNLEPRVTAPVTCSPVLRCANFQVTMHQESRCPIFVSPVMIPNCLKKIPPREECTKHASLMLSE